MMTSLLWCMAFASLLLAPMAAAATQTAESPGLPHAALHSELRQAIGAIEANLTAVRQAHSDLFPVAPAPTWIGHLDSAPFQAFDEAARALADLRVRVVLDVPAGTTESRLATTQVESRIANWTSSIQANASAVIAMGQRVRAPSDPAALEELLLRYLPAYETVLHVDDLKAALVAQDLGHILRLMVPREAERVAWESLRPTEPPVPSSLLGRPFVLSVLENASYSGSQSDPVLQGKARSNIALQRSRLLDALAFGLATERAYVEHNASFVARGTGRDLRPQLEAEHMRLQSRNASALAQQATAVSYALLSQPAGSSDSDRMAEALGQLSAIRMLQGLPLLPVAYPAEQDFLGSSSSNPAANQGAPGPGATLLGVALAIALVVGRRPLR